MPLFHITWAAGRPRKIKEQVREDISRNMGELAGIAPGFIAVLFMDLGESDIVNHNALAEVYISEGRTDIFKDNVAALVTNAVCRYTGWAGSTVSVIIHDLRKGSVAVGGKIVNRFGTAVEAVIGEKKL